VKYALTKDNTKGDAHSLVNRVRTDRISKVHEGKTRKTHSSARKRGLKGPRISYLMSPTNSEGDKRIIPAQRTPSDIEFKRRNKTLIHIQSSLIQRVNTVAGKKKTFQNINQTDLVRKYDTDLKFTKKEVSNDDTNHHRMDNVKNSYHNDESVSIRNTQV